MGHLGVMSIITFLFGRGRGELMDGLADRRPSLGLFTFCGLNCLYAFLSRGRSKRWCLRGSINYPSIPTFKRSTVFPFPLRRYVRYFTWYNKVFACRLINSSAPYFQVFQVTIRYSTKGTRRYEFFDRVT